MPDDQIGNIGPDLRARLERQHSATAPDVVTDAQREAVRVAALSLALGRVARVIPGRAGELFAQFVAGAHKNPATSEVTFAPGVAGNFAPAPVGFTHAESFGLEPNFFLPAGSSSFLPEFLDPLGFGTREQRAADAATRAAEIQQQSADRVARLAVAAQSTPTAVLEAAAAGEPLPGAGAGAFQFGAADITEQRTAAAAELMARAAAAQPVADLAASVAPVLPSGFVELPESDRAVFEQLHALDEFARLNPPDP